MATPLASAALSAVLKTVSKKLLAIGGKKIAATTAGKAAATAAGLTEAQIAGIASGKLNVLNIMRAKFVKSAAPQVAKSLGMTTKELNALIKELKIKETYSAYVKGKAYVQNAKRIMQNPETAAANLGRKKIITEVSRRTNSAVNDLLGDTFDNNSSDEEKQSRANKNKILLDNIQDTLNSFPGEMKLPPYLWDNAEVYDPQVLQDIVDMMEDDNYYTVEGYDYNFVMVVGELQGTGNKGGGSYILAYEPDEYIQYITNLIEDGYSSESADELR